LKISGSMGVLLAVLSAALQLGIVQGGVPLTCCTCQELSDTFSVRHHHWAQLTDSDLRHSWQHQQCRTEPQATPAAVSDMCKQCMARLEAPSADLPYVVKIALQLAAAEEQIEALQRENEKCVSRLRRHLRWPRLPTAGANPRAWSVRLSPVVHRLRHTHGCRKPRKPRTALSPARPVVPPRSCA